MRGNLASCRRPAACRSVGFQGVIAATAVPGQFVLDTGPKTIGRDRPPWLPSHGAIPTHPQAVISRVSDHHAVCEVPDDVCRPQVAASFPRRLTPGASTRAEHGRGLAP